TKCHGIGQCLPRRMSMTPFFLAGTAFLRARPPGLSHLAGSRTSPARALSLVTAGRLCLPPGRGAAARPNGPRPIDAAAAPLSSFHDFIAPLVRNHDVPDQANDTVAGFGNTLRQDIAGRHVPGKE